jgi:hypothetical protein
MGCTIDLLIFSKPIFVPTQACLIDNRLLPVADAAGPGCKVDPSILHDMITVIDAPRIMCTGARRGFQLLAGKAKT